MTSTLDPLPDLVLFDLDDTLCDYGAARRLRLSIAFRQALAARPTDDPIDVDQLVAESIALQPHGNEHFPALLAPHGVSAEAAADAMAWHGTNRFHGLALFPESRDLLRSLRTQRPQARIGMITNGPADVQRAKIALLELEPEVDFIFISGEFGVAKPDPAIFRAALERGGAAPERAVFVGDSAEFDMTGAHNAGIPAIWLNRPRDPWSRPIPAPAHDVASLHEVARLLAIELA